MTRGLNLALLGDQPQKVSVLCLLSLTALFRGCFAPRRRRFSLAGLREVEDVDDLRLRLALVAIGTDSILIPASDGRMVVRSARASFVYDCYGMTSRFGEFC